MSWYLYPIFGIYLISCLILIVVVLLQSGKGDAASAFGGGVGNAAFGPRGAATTLAKVTMGAAIAFMLFAFIFSLPGVLKSGSVAYGIADKPVQQQPAPAQQQPAQPATTPAQPVATPAQPKPEEKKEEKKEESKEEKKGEATAPAEKSEDKPAK